MAHFINKAYYWKYTYNQLIIFHKDRVRDSNYLIHSIQLSVIIYIICFYFYSTLSYSYILFLLLEK